jgi:hypothetical protein
VSRYFGSYLHHAPADDHGAAQTTAAGGRSPKAASFNDFRLRYEEQLFGHPLPAGWYDDGTVAPSRRVIDDMVGTLTVIVDDRTVHLMDGTGDTVLAVNELACEATDFIAHTRDFYVRELPGDLTGEEKVGVVQPLVRLGVLRLAP